MRQYVEVWVCPRCSNYYGSSVDEGKDLTREINTGRKRVATVDGREIWANVPTHSRAQCPNCGTERVAFNAYLQSKRPTEAELREARELANRLERERGNEGLY